MEFIINKTEKRLETHFTGTPAELVGAIILVMSKQKQIAEIFIDAVKSYQNFSKEECKILGRELLKL